MQHHQKQNTQVSPRYVVLAMEYRMRSLKYPMAVPGKRGKKIDAYLAPVVTEYLDTETGEILKADDLRRENRHDFYQPFHASERVLQREAVLNSLRPEVRKFALFVLKFRNHRRGITTVPSPAR